MKQPLSPLKAMERLEHLCSRAEHSEFELRRKLAQWGVDSASSSKIIRELKETRMVDDSRFARAFCRDKVRFDRWGPARIRQGLYAKGIDSCLISEVIGEIEEDDLTESLRRLLKAKIRAMGASPGSREDRERLVRFAIVRGFSGSMIFNLLKSKELWVSED